MFRSSLGASFLLVVGTVFWGMTFVFIQEGIKHIGVFGFIYYRFLIAFLVLCLFFYPKLIQLNKQVVYKGCVLGLFMAGSIFTQTLALQYTTASKSAFITGLAVIFVPLVNGLFYTKRFPKWIEMLAVLIALVGVAMLTITDGFGSLNKGDFLTLLCAISFAFYIIKVDHYSNKADPILLTIIQMLFITLVALCFTLIINKKLSLPPNLISWSSILFCAIPATAVMFTIQNYYQRYVTPPLRVAIIFSLEPVFAAITSYFYLGEIIGFIGMLGAACILLSMILPELKFNK